MDRALAARARPSRYGVTVLAVQCDRGRGQDKDLPDPQRPLAAGDRIVVAGTPDSLRRMHAT